MTNLELTLEDCENLLEAEAFNTSCVMLAASHGMNPFDKLSGEKITAFHEAWKKIEDFVKENKK